MPNTYVIPDTHGRYDLLELALDWVRDADDSGTVVFLGDYVDRGFESKSIIDRLIAGPEENWEWVCLRGNHEDMLLECHDTQDNQLLSWWYSNGGMSTMSSYDGSVPPEHIDWIANLPRIHWDDHRVYVHAGVNPSWPLEEQPEKYTQWYRYPEGADIGHGDRHVVHGHTPIGPELYENRTNLDGGAVRTGKLWVAYFEDDKPGGPVGMEEISRS